MLTKQAMHRRITAGYSNSEGSEVHLSHRKENRTVARKDWGGGEKLGTAYLLDPTGTDFHCQCKRKIII